MDNHDMPNHPTATKPAMTPRWYAESKTRRFVDRNRWAQPQTSQERRLKNSLQRDRFDA